MSTLPTPVIPERTIVFQGASVTVRSLTRSEAYTLTKIVEDDDKENFVLACGTNSTVQEATDWRAQVGFNEATPLIDAILEVSGLKLTVVEDDGPKA